MKHQPESHKNGVNDGDRVWVQDSGVTRVAGQDESEVFLIEPMAPGEQFSPTRRIGHMALMEMLALRRAISLSLPPIWSKWSGTFDGKRGKAKVMDYGWDADGGFVKLDVTRGDEVSVVILPVQQFRQSIDSAAFIKDNSPPQKNSTAEVAA